MSIRDGISRFLKRYKEENHLSYTELANQLGVGKNTAINCLNGFGNPCADTIDIFAEKCGVSVAEMISAHSLGWEQAEMVERAARVLGDLPPERQEKGVQLFLALVRLFSKEDIT